MDTPLEYRCYCYECDTNWPIVFTQNIEKGAPKILYSLIRDIHELKKIGGY